MRKAIHANYLCLFVMVLGHSRATYIKFTRRCDIHSFLRCFVHALEHFGGVPKVVLTDRMKTVVLGTGDDGHPLWHPVFQDFVYVLSSRFPWFYHDLSGNRRRLTWSLCEV